MEEQKKPKEEGKTAPFNMGIDTLVRCGKILENLKMASATPTTREFNGVQKQIMRINLTKQFFLQCSPLLKEEVAKEYSDKILDLTPTIKRKTVSGGYRALNKSSLIYDFDIELDKKIDELILELQRELQKEGKYMMPSKNDPRFSWGQDS